MRGLNLSRGWVRWAGAVAVGVAVLAVIAGAAWNLAQDDAPAAAAVTSGDARLSEAELASTERSAATSPSDGQAEGIQVHGDWVIEVSNPDGTLARVVEFENALYPDTGASHLVAVLSRVRSQGRWAVAIGETGSGGPCLVEVPGGTEPSACFLVEPTLGVPTPGTQIVETLTVSNSNLGRTMVLNGSAFALTDGVIDFVQTTAWVCAGTVAPNSCTFDQAQESREFTSATLPAPVELIEGQHVTVRVSISFP